MKKKKIIIIIIISIAIITSVVSIISLNKKPEKKDYFSKCYNIEEDIRDNKDFAIYISIDSVEFDEVMSNFNKRYPKVKIDKINYSNIKEKCFKNIIKETGLENDLKNNKDSYIIMYKNGKYVGVAINPPFQILEESMDKYGIIKKEEIDKDYTLEKYNEKIKSDKYYLLLIGNEDKKAEYKRLMAKVFENEKYDVINYNESDNGKKVLEEIRKNNEIGNEFPRLLYFKNGKLIENGLGYSEEAMKGFKEETSKK